MKKIISILYFLPFISLAEGDGKTAESFIKLITGYMSIISEILFVAVVVAFFYGLFLFILDDDKREKGKGIMIWGVIFIFVMASIWGLVEFLQISVFGSAQTEQHFEYPDVSSKSS